MNRKMNAPSLCIGTLCLSLLAACSTTIPESAIVPGPLNVTPPPRPQNIERINSGSIFQPGMDKVFLSLSETKARRVGDTVKVAISETLNATNTVNNANSRDTKLASKGPGSKAGLGLISSIMNLDATASGSDSFTGAGTTANASTFTGQLAASVINVLPNGNLVVAGDRAISLNGSVSVLRFSGIVNPQDIKPGNIVASSDTVNAKFEVVGRGEVSDASSRTWMQRVLADSLAFW